MNGGGQISVTPRSQLGNQGSRAHHLYKGGMCLLRHKAFSMLAVAAGALRPSDQVAVSG